MTSNQIPSLRVIPNNSICVEVGTCDGNFSYELLKNTSCKKLYCVDPYKHYTNNEYPDGINDLTQEEFDTLYEKTKEKLSEFGDRVEFLRMESIEASKMFENESLDFVYIDGNHEYSYVLNDIIHWYPTVKKGGFLCGDDIHSTNLGEHDASGNVRRVWNNKFWGLYGTYKAVLDGRRYFNYNFTIDRTQFIIKR